MDAAGGHHERRRSLPPQGISLQKSLFADHKVRVFLCNQQVTDPLTALFLQAAAKAAVPVVGACETMPTPGYDYRSWMLAGVRALQKAVTSKISTDAVTAVRDRHQVPG